MSPDTVFQLHLVLGYVAWLLLFGVYVLPRLRSGSNRTKIDSPVFAHAGFRSA